MALSKGELRTLRAQAKEARMWAGEQVAKAAYAAAEDDVASFHGYMAEAGRLALISAKLIKRVEAES